MGRGSRIAHQTHPVGTTRLLDPSETTASQEGGVGTGDSALSPVVRITDREVPPDHVRDDLVRPLVTDSAWVGLPRTPEDLRAIIGQEGVADVDIHAQFFGGDGPRVTGDARVCAEADGTFTVLAAGPRCSENHPHEQDAAGRCAHVREIGQSVAGLLNGRPAGAPERMAAQQALVEAEADHEASLVEQQRIRNAHDAAPPAPSYAQNMAAFQAAWDAARARRAAGEPPVPYMTENATGGLGARDGGRAFGVEIEFDFPADMPREERRRARRAIAEDMFRAGLARDSRQHGYHASQQAGYTDAANGWRLEEDTTVDGEIVSPILYDEPATWNNLAQVCEIIRSHGGIANQHTGGHVHVAVPDFDHAVQNHQQLLSTVRGYEDELYRLAQNPAQSRHRGMDWCRPNRSPGTGYTSVAQMAGANWGHGLALNFQAVGGTDRDHVEFRMWDGSLEPGVIQAQINMSLGLANAAVRDAGRRSAPPARPVGTSRTQLARDGFLGPNGRLRRNVTGERWVSLTAPFRSLVDRVFTQEANRAQATALFAATSWQRG